MTTSADHLIPPLRERKVAMETVNHPDHYGGDTTYEVIKVIEAWGLGFHLGNAVKYISRAGKKDPARTIEDLQKAIWYVERFIQQEKANGSQPSVSDTTSD